MNSLEKAIKKALDLAGTTVEANKAYLEFIKANFLVPVDKHSEENAPEVLFLQENDKIYLPVFTSRQYLDEWAHDIQDSIHILTLSGVNLLKGLGDEVSVCLNIGNPLYKEFNPAELARMRSMVLKFFQ